MNTILLKYEILEDLENNRVSLRLFFDQFLSEEDKPITISLKLKFTDEIIYSNYSLIYIEKAQDALERTLLKYNLKAIRFSAEENENICLEIKSLYEKFN
jgi:hypothetical protein